MEWNLHHPQHLHAPNDSYPPMQNAFPPPSHHAPECCRPQPENPVMEYTGGHTKAASMASDEDDPSFTAEDGGKRGSPWHRVKWTDGMVRLLITAASYIGEDNASACCNGIKRKSVILQKKGKWKSISMVMSERGCYVSPQQCEDKFNDLNKRYKKLTDILGRGTSCRVVENPALLNSMGQLSDKTKDEVRKILSSKQLFYEEMCSYHNWNRFHLPADPALHQSLLGALRSGEAHDTVRTLQEDAVEDDHGVNTDDGEHYTEEFNIFHRAIGGSCFPKKMKQGVNYEDVVFGTPPASQDSNKMTHPQGISVDMNQVIPEGSNTDRAQKQWVSCRSLELEEKSLKIQTQMLELEQQHFRWQRVNRKKDMELVKMRMENEKMKFENKQLELELKRKRLEFGLN